jgi:ribosome-associated protein
MGTMSFHSQRTEAQMIGPDDETKWVRINEQLAISLSELAFRFSRSSGPGGQHVQRSDTRVELLFDVANSPSLSEEQRERIRHRLGGYLDNEGVLRVVSSATRSQLGNREDAIQRFQTLIAGALRVHRRRVPTKPSAGAREQRLTAKRTRSQVKQMRRKPGGDD